MGTISDGSTKEEIKRPLLEPEDPEGVKLAHRLAEKADVVLLNFRPGRAEAMGVGPEDLHRTNPDLIISLVSAYGQTRTPSGSAF
jgi:CoA:oxalate CoA-transferase